MKHSIIFLVACLLSSVMNYAQPNFSWVKTVGGTDYDNATSISLDDQGNVYTTGYFRGTCDFDPGAGVFNLTSVDYGDVFVTKFDSSGNFVWAKRVGGNGDDYGYGIAYDHNGNVVITGYFNSTVDFDPGAGNFYMDCSGDNDPDIFVVKLDTLGNFVWAKELEGPDTDRARAITTDAAGYIYSTGSFEDTADFDPGPGYYYLMGSGGDDVYVSKLDPDGNFVWAGAFAGTNANSGRSIAVDPSGNVFTTGEFINTADFDPGPTVYNMVTPWNYSDIFISKLDMDGHFVWAKQIGGTYDDGGLDITTDITGNVYTSGTFEQTVDFDPGAGTYNMTTPSVPNTFFLKLTSAGNFVWARSLIGASDNHGYAIAVDGAQNFYATGDFGATVDFDPGIGNYSMSSSGFSGADMFVLKYDAGGNFVWAFKLTCSIGMVGFDIQLDNFGHLYTTGIYSYTCDFNPGPPLYNVPTAGVTDGFVHRMWYCNLLSAPPTITGNANICAGSSNTYNISTVPGATSYTWGLPSGWSGSSATTSINTTAGLMSGHVLVTANNGCGASLVQNLFVNVTSPPVITTSINGPTNVCAGATEWYNLAPVSNASSYAWTLPPTWAGSSTTDSISTFVGVSGGNVSVTASNFCGTSTPQVLPVTVVFAAPGIPGTISGNATTCEGSSNLYTIAPVAAASSYIWTLPSGWSGTSTTDSILTTASANSGNVSVEAVNGCGSSALQSLSVVVNPLPNVGFTISPNDTVCFGDTITLSGTGASSYMWTGGVLDAVPFMADSSLSYSVTGTDANGCSNTDYCSLIVFPNPNVYLGPDYVLLSPPFTIDAGAGFTSYLWNTSETTQSISVNVAGNYLVTVTNIYGCTDSDDINIYFTIGLQHEDGSKPTIELFPNPATEYVLLKLTKPGLMKMFEVNGKLMIAKNLTEGLQLIDLNSISPGVYFISLLNEDGYSSVRFIKTE